MSVNFLVVDDDKLLPGMFKNLLSAAYEGAEVRIAFDSDSAFRQMENFIPSLITTDINRPGGDGYEFLTKIKNHPMLRHIPVIVISGTSSSEINELRQYRHGFNAVLAKPFTLEKFIATINSVLHLNSNTDAAMIHAGFESRERDYKEYIDLTDKKGRASLAKDVIAFANYGGGTIILGVSESSPGKFKPVGVPGPLISSFEVTQVNQAIRPFLDPPISVIVRSVQDGTKEFLFIEVPAAKEAIILAAKKNEAAGLYPGRIYTRTTDIASAETQSSTELREVLSHFISNSVGNTDKK